VPRPCRRRALGDTRERSLRPLERSPDVVIGAAAAPRGRRDPMTPRRATVAARIARAVVRFTRRGEQGVVVPGGARGCRRLGLFVEGCASFQNTPA